MADDRSAKFRNFPIRKYVDAILERNPGKGLPYEPVCDDNDFKNRANQRSVSNHNIPVDTQASESSEAERVGQEIVIFKEPIEPELSDESKTSSQNDTDSDFEISEDSDTELQDDAVFELETVKEHVTISERTAIQPAKAITTTKDSDYDTSRTISDIPTGLGNVSRCPNDESVNGGVNNNENNVPFDDANSGKIVNQFKEKGLILMSHIMRNLHGSKKKSDKRCGSKAIDVEDDDDITLFLSRKRKANKVDLNKQKEVNVKKPRFDEAETSKQGAARRSGRRFESSGSGSMVVRADKEKKQKVFKASKPRLDIVEHSNRGPKEVEPNADKNERFATVRKVPKALLLTNGETRMDKFKESSTFDGLRQFELTGLGSAVEAKKQKVVPADEPQLAVAKPLNHVPKGLKTRADKNDSLITARKVDKALRLAGSNGELLELLPSGSGSVSDRDGSMQMQKVIKADDPRINVVKPSNRGAKDHADDDDCLVTARKLSKALRLADNNSAADKCKASGTFGGLRGFKPSGSQSMVVRAGETIKKNPVKADEPPLDVVKPSNRGPKKSKSNIKEIDRFATVRRVDKDFRVSGSETETDKASYGFGGLLRIKPSGSLSVVAGKANKQQAVQAKDLKLDAAKPSNRGPKGFKLDAEKNDRFATAKKMPKNLHLDDGTTAYKHKASGSAGLLRVFEPSGSRSGLGQVDEVKKQNVAKAIEPWLNVAKQTNNGPKGKKLHAKCKESGVCSGIDKCEPSASVPVGGRAGDANGVSLKKVVTRPVEREAMVCVVNRNPADFSFESAKRFMRRI